MEVLELSSLVQQGLDQKGLVSVLAGPPGKGGILVIMCSLYHHFPVLREKIELGSSSKVFWAGPSAFGHSAPPLHPPPPLSL